jgi:hypothetical protein
MADRPDTESAKTPIPPMTLDELGAWYRQVRARGRPALTLLARSILDSIQEVNEQCAGIQKSIDQMSEDTGLPARTARAGLAELEAADLLKRQPVGGTPGKGSQRANLLVPTLPQPAESLQPPSRAGPEAKKKPGPKDPAIMGRLDAVPEFPAEPRDKPKQASKPKKRYHL